MSARSSTTSGSNESNEINESNESSESSESSQHSKKSRWFSAPSSSLSARDCRVYGASALRLFAAFTDCRHFYLWWPPSYSFTVRSCALPPLLQLHVRQRQISEQPQTQTQLQRQPKTQPQGPMRPGALAQDAGGRSANASVNAVDDDVNVRSSKGSSDSGGVMGVAGAAASGGRKKDSREELKKEAELHRQQKEQFQPRWGALAGSDESTVVDINSEHGVYTMQIVDEKTRYVPGGVSTVALQYGGPVHGGIFDGDESISIEDLPVAQDGTERCRVCYRADIVPKSRALRSMMLFVTENTAKSYFDPLFDSLHGFVEREEPHAEPHPRIRALHRHDEIWKALVGHHAQTARDFGDKRVRSGRTVPASDPTATMTTTTATTPPMSSTQTEAAAAATVAVATAAAAAAAAATTANSSHSTGSQDAIDPVADNLTEEAVTTFETSAAGVSSVSTSHSSEAITPNAAGEHEGTAPMSDLSANRAADIATSAQEGGEKASSDAVPDAVHAEDEHPEGEASSRVPTVPKLVTEFAERVEQAQQAAADHATPTGTPEDAAGTLVELEPLLSIHVRKSSRESKQSGSNRADDENPVNRVRPKTKAERVEAEFAAKKTDVRVSSDSVSPVSSLPTFQNSNDSVEEEETNGTATVLIVLPLVDTDGQKPHRPQRPKSRAEVAEAELRR